MQPQQQRVQLRVIAAVCGGLADLGEPVVGDGPSWPGCAAAAPGSGPCARCTTTPGGPAGLPRLRGPGRVHPGLIVEGFALFDAATGQHGQAMPQLAWLAAHRTPRSAQISAASAGCAVPPKTAISPNFGSPGFPAATAAGRGTP